MQKSDSLKRIDILAMILLGCMAVFVLRLFYLQVVQYQAYTDMAKFWQQRNFTIQAARGEIYMMDNEKPVPVVLNRTVYMVIADPETVEKSDHQDIVTALKDVASGEMVGEVEAKLKKQGSRYEVLARNISRTQAEKLKEKDFAGIRLYQTTTRSYPEGRLGAHALGFVNFEGEGQYGVEQQLNDSLKGRDGMLQSVADVRDVPLTLGKDNIRIEPKSGDDIVLTIDRNIQSHVEDALKAGLEKVGATEGSVLVLDPDSGEVKAMANYPTYDPTDFNRVTDGSVFMNGTTMSPYEPASVIKAFTLATAIDRGAISASTVYQNTDCIAVADRTMCNALRGLSGPTTMQSVLDNSFNVGTIVATRRLSNSGAIDLTARQIMYDYFYNKFGLGQKTNIEVTEENGHIYSPDSVEGNEVRYSAMTFGQSLSLTMIQVAAGFSSIVNGGDYYKPTLVAGKIDDSGKLNSTDYKPLRRTISESASAEITQMLVSARKSSWVGRGDKSGFVVGGKTGTAETIGSDGSYTKNETVATYIGFGGANQPEYVIMVRVAAPGKGLNLEGGLHAGPIFTDISNWMIDYMKLVPRG